MYQCEGTTGRWDGMSKNGLHTVAKSDYPGEASEEGWEQEEQEGEPEEPSFVW